MGTWHGNKDPRVEIPRFWNEHKEKPIVISEFGLCEPAFAGGDPRRTEIFLEKMKIYRELGINGIIWFCLNDYRPRWVRKAKVVFAAECTDRQIYTEIQSHPMRPSRMSVRHSISNRSLFMIMMEMKAKKIQKKHQVD